MLQSNNHLPASQLPFLIIVAIVFCWFCVFFCASVGEYKETNRAAVLQLLKDSAASLVFWLMRCSLCLQMRSMCGRQPLDTLLIVARLQALFSSLCWISDLHSFFFFAPSRNTPTTHLLFPPSVHQCIIFLFTLPPAVTPSPHCSPPASIFIPDSAAD